MEAPLPLVDEPIIEQKSGRKELSTGRKAVLARVYKAAKTRALMSGATTEQAGEAAREAFRQMALELKLGHPV